MWPDSKYDTCARTLAPQDAQCHGWDGACSGWSLDRQTVHTQQRTGACAAGSLQQTDLSATLPSSCCPLAALLSGFGTRSPAVLPLYIACHHADLMQPCWAQDCCSECTALDAGRSSPAHLPGCGERSASPCQQWWGPAAAPPAAFQMPRWPEPQRHISVNSLEHCKKRSLRLGPRSTSVRSCLNVRVGGTRGHCLLASVSA